MDRRRFLLTSLASAFATPLAAEAQQAVVRRIGTIAAAPRTPVTESFWSALTDGLRERGWIEGRNLIVERRDIEFGRAVAMAAAAELIRAGVEVIVVSSTLTALAAKDVTRIVPIVMTVPSDPVAVGLVASLSRPGGNVTGLSFVGTEIAGKQVEILKTLLPGFASISVLANPTNASHAPRTREIVTAARAMNLQVAVVDATSGEAIPSAFRAMLKQAAGAAMVLADALFVREMANIIRLAAEHRLPVMYGLREGPLAGGLVSYGLDFVDLFRRAAGYVDKVLRGAHPRDLPIEQASTFQLVINVRTARALSITIPPSLLARADQVIE
jgi:putative tryptophan/tyrosine transport system substrate-binding protein